MIKERREEKEERFKKELEVQKEVESTERGREYVRKSGQHRKLLVNILADRDELIRKNTLSGREL